MANTVFVPVTMICALNCCCPLPFTVIFCAEASTCAMTSDGEMAASSSASPTSVTLLMLSVMTFTSTPEGAFTTRISLTVMARGSP